MQFIATILHDPDLLIIDEPFSGLDPVNTDMVKGMIYRMRDEGRTVIMSIHEMHQVEEMADRLIMINKGKRVLYGSVDEVRGQYAENAVIISGKGDWGAIPGVVSIHSNDGGRAVTLKLDAGVTPIRSCVMLPTSPIIRLRALPVPSHA
ncbi:MAG: hypothetical protein HS103_06100 [Anaerolineales bacterium]|nr:hypothetical protein [Anaerolineales bacterium]